MENEGGQLPREESEFIYEKEDLVSIRPGKEHAWLDGLLERILRLLRCKLIIVSSGHPKTEIHSIDQTPKSSSFAPR